MTNLDLRLDGETIHVDKIAFLDFGWPFYLRKIQREARQLKFSIHFLRKHDFFKHQQVKHSLQITSLGHKLFKTPSNT